MNEEYEYIKTSFTKDNENVNLEVDNLNVGCITSKNNNFSLDSDGNLTVKSVIAQEGLLSYQEILNFIYPVGSIYITVSDVNPAITLGGTWEQIVGRFLLASNDNYDEYKLGATGGTVTKNIAHTHGLSNGYALLNPSANVAALYGSVNTSVTSWTDNFKMTVSGKATTNSTANTRAIKLAGNSNSGGSTALNIMPPYLSVNVWKRIS